MLDDSRLNPLDYEPDGETFGIGPSPLARLSRDQFAAAEALHVTLTGDMLFLATAMQTPIPFLPIQVGQETSLMRRLIARGFKSAAALTQEWNSLCSNGLKLKYVNGETIFFKCQQNI